MSANGVTTLLAIDPGDKQSAFVLYDGHTPQWFGKWDNYSLLRAIQVEPRLESAHFAIETLKPRGMPTAFEEMQAQLWAGRFMQAWDHRHGGDKFGVNAPEQVFRADVKKHICGKMTANDSNIRQALIDLWGGKDVAIGGKKCRKCKGKQWTGRDRKPCDCDGGWQFPPGPLKGIADDCWSALAIARTYFDTKIQPLT